MRNRRYLFAVLGIVWISTGLFVCQSPTAGAQVISEDGTENAQLMTLISEMRRHAEARNEALRYSRGSCAIRSIYVAGEDRPEEERGVDLTDLDFSIGRSAEVVWRQRDTAIRYDKKVSAGGHYLLPAQNERVLISPREMLCYDIDRATAYVDNPPPAAWNPISIVIGHFDPSLLYSFRGELLHDQLLRYVEAGRFPKMSEIERDGEPLLKLEYRWEPGDGGRERKGFQYFLVAPKRVYSLVEAVYTNKFFHEGESRGETFASYTAVYEASNTRRGIWLHKSLRYLTNEAGTLDAIEVDFGDIEVDVDFPESDFEETTLGMPPGIEVVDRRLLHLQGSEDR